MAREIITTERAPAPVGPYSQAVKVDGWVYTAGQIPLDPATGKKIDGAAAAAAERVLMNLQAIVEAAGGSMADAVKVTVYLNDLNDFAAMNAVFERFFPKDPPASSTLVTDFIFPGMQVEIEAVAYKES